MEALGNHPNIETGMEKLAALKEKKKSAQDQLQWMRDYFTAPDVPSQFLARGFKTKLQDVLDLNSFRESLEELKVRVIHLRRRNVVKSTVSFFNSVRLNDTTGDWNLYEEGNRLPPLTVEIDQFDKWLKGGEDKNANELAFVNTLALPTITLQYEDLLVNEDATFASVFTFLGVKHHPIKGYALKNTSDDLREVLANFDELRAHYAHTKYQAMFDEVLFANQ